MSSIDLAGALLAETLYVMMATFGCTSCIIEAALIFDDVTSTMAIVWYQNNELEAGPYSVHHIDVALQALVPRYCGSTAASAAFRCEPPINPV